MGNPFQDESAHLLELDTKDIVDPVTSSWLSHIMTGEKTSSVPSLRDYRKTRRAPFNSQSRIENQLKRDSWRK